MAAQAPPQVAEVSIDAEPASAEELVAIAPAPAATRPEGSTEGEKRGGLWSRLTSKFKT
jgi:hypothetical protein